MSSQGWRRAGGPHRGHRWSPPRGWAGGPHRGWRRLGVLTEAIDGVLTEDGEGLGVFTEAIGWCPHRGWRRAGGPHRGP